MSQQALQAPLSRERNGRSGYYPPVGPNMQHAYQLDTAGFITHAQLDTLSAHAAPYAPSAVQAQVHVTAAWFGRARSVLLG